MSTFGILNQSSRKTYVVNVGTVADSTVPIDGLAAGQIGFLKTSKGPNGVLIAPSFSATPTHDRSTTWNILQGVHVNDTAFNLNAVNSNFSKRFVEFKATDIVGFTAKRGRKATQTQKIAVGYDGLNTDKTFKVKKYKDTIFNFKLTGEPINKVFGSRNGYVGQIVIPHECYDECAETNDPLCVIGSSDKAVDQLIHFWNERKINGIIPLNRFARISKTSTNATTTNIDVDVFRVTLPDNGDQISLGFVQAQYPGKEIKRISYDNYQSTYEVVLPDGSAAPAAVTNASLTALFNCATCPTGYTATTTTKKFEVTLNHGAATTAFTGVTGYSANIAISKSVDKGDKYFVWSTSATNETTFAAAIVTNGGQAVYMGTDGNVCTLTSATTYTWGAAGSYSAQTKQYKLTLEDTECGTTRLADVQLAYPTLTITGDALAVDCKRNYLTAVTSNYQDMATCDPEGFTFKKPQPFEGSVWVEVPTSTTEPTAVGVIFETAVFRKKNVTDCTYDFWTFGQDEVGGVHLEVSVHSDNYNDVPCADDIPVTRLRNFVYPSGEGWFVRKMEEETMGYELNQYRYNPALRDAYGFQWQSDLNGFYDNYQLFVESSVHAPNGSLDRVAKKRYQYNFFFKPGQGKAFESAVNSLIASAGIDVLPVSL